MSAPAAEPFSDNRDGGLRRKTGRGLEEGLRDVTCCH